MKIGILGGTFDPPHIGHLAMAEAAWQQLGLSKVWIMPTGNPGYKGRENITDKYIRSDMVKLSIKNNCHFEFSDIELNRNGIIYTYDTLCILKEKYPSDEFYFIIGGDSIKNILSWHMPEEIFKMCTIAVACRDDVCDESLFAIAEKLRKNYGASIVMINMMPLAISSSKLRDMCKNGSSVRYLVSDETYEYILKHKLYQ